MQARRKLVVGQTCAAGNPIQEIPYKKATFTCDTATTCAGSVDSPGRYRENRQNQNADGNVRNAM
jgi:hypothetical protein